MNGRPRHEPPPAGVEAVLLAVCLVAAGVGVAVGAGAWLAAGVSGGTVSGGLGDWLSVAIRLAQRPGDPAAAWGHHASRLPGPLVYWACTGMVALAGSGAGWGVVRVWRRWSVADRSRFGAPVDARVARHSDVRPLVVRSTRPPVGRMLLGRMAPRGPLLATEDRDRHPMRGRARRRQGHRGSVALVGPTQSGKTALASSAIVAWDGPVVALSVKRDLYATTAAARAKAGEIAVFDPGGVTGLPSARWSPLRDVTTASGALRAGRALAEAIPRTGVQGGDFWAQHGEAFISAYFSLAGLSQLLPKSDGTPRQPLTIERLATWAYMGVGITHSLVNELVHLGLQEDQPIEVRLLARNAATKLMAHHREDPRIRGSIYATARLAFEAWSEPACAHSASLDPRRSYDSAASDRWDHEPRWIDLDWLMGDPDDGRANTLYLSAPDTEFARLAPVLGGLLGDLREQIHAWDIQGRRLEKPLLIVVDEAGQLELGWLPAEVSTIAGLGAMLVTCWQSKAQITDRYGTLADAVLSGHRSKIFFAGVDDPATTDYVAKLAGTEHIAQRGWNVDLHGGHRSVSEQPQREELLPAHVVRQMTPQEAVLIHGTLPPIHLRTVRWWDDPDLRRLIPTDRHGRPVAPDDVPTCPLSDRPATTVGTTLDLAAVDDPAALLPGARRPGSPNGRRRPSRPADDDIPRADDLPPPQVPPAAAKPVHPRQLPRRRTRPAGGLQNQLPFPDPAPLEMADHHEANRVAGVCERCGRWVPVGAGEVVRLGHRDTIRCHPACPDGPAGPSPHRHREH